MRKNIILSLATLSMALSLIGCKVSEGERNDRRTLYGFSMLREEVNAFFRQECAIMFLTKAVAQYNEQTDPEMQQAIINTWFHGKTIAHSDNKTIVTFNNGAFFSVSKNSVLPQGARWSYSIISYDSHKYSELQMMVTAYANDQYVLSNKDIGEINYMIAPPAITAKTATLNANNYKNIASNSLLTFVDTKVEAFTDPYKYLNFLPIKGNVVLEYDENTKPEYHVDGVFSSTATRFNIRILYRGVTEDYINWIR